MNDELLYAIDLEDPSGEFEPASELLNALELDFSSFFDRENGVTFLIYSVAMRLSISSTLLGMSAERSVQPSSVIR